MYFLLICLDNWKEIPCLYRSEGMNPLLIINGYSRFTKNISSKRILDTGIEI